MKRIITIITVLAALSVLTTCSGVLGGDTMVRITVPGLDDGTATGRLVSDDATEGYVVVLKKDKVYSLNNFDSDAFFQLKGGNVVIANLPLGDYIFGVVLVDGDPGEQVVGIAVKEFEVKSGLNSYWIDVGPGISDIRVNGLDYSDFFKPEGYTAEFAEDTIILNVNRNGSSDDVVQLLGATFGGSEAAPVLGTPTIIGGPTDGDPAGGSYDVPAASNGIRFPFNSGAYQIRVILK